MHHDAIADGGAGVNDHARIDAAVLADAHACADDRAGFNAGSCANFRAVADDRTGGDGHIRAELDVGADDRGRMNAFGGERRREQLGGAGKPETRLIVFNDCDGQSGARSPELARFENHRAGRADSSAGRGAASSAKTRSPRRQERRQFTPRISVCGVAMRQFAAECCDQLSKRHAALPMSRFRYSINPARPAAGSSSGGESRATGQDSAESRIRSRPSHAVCLPEYPRRGRRARHFDLGTEAEHVASLGRLPEHEAREHGGAGLPGDVGQAGPGAGVDAEKRHKLALRRGHIRVHQDADSAAGVR